MRATTSTFKSDETGNEIMIRREDPRRPAHLMVRNDDLQVLWEATLAENNAHEIAHQVCEAYYGLDRQGRIAATSSMIWDVRQELNRWIDA